MIDEYELFITLKSDEVFGIDNKIKTRVAIDMREIESMFEDEPIDGFKTTCVTMKSGDAMTILTKYDDMLPRWKKAKALELALPKGTLY